MNEPVKVEVINSADWWLPWLPLLGSLVVAVAAVVGVVVNNRTNRAAITAADRRAREDRSDAERRAREDRAEAAKQADGRIKEDRIRDFRTWKRDRILEIATDVTESAVGAEDEYRRIAYSVEIDTSVPGAFIQVSGLTRRLGHSVTTLSIIGEHELANLARSIRTAANNRDLVTTVRRLNILNRKLRPYDDGSDPNGERISGEYEEALSRLRADNDGPKPEFERVMKEVDEARQRLAREADALEPELERLLQNVNEARAYFGAAAEEALRNTTHPAAELELSFQSIVPRGD